MGGRGWGRRCHSHLAATKLFICPCGIKPQRQDRTSHAQERKEQGQKGVKKKVRNKLGEKKHKLGPKTQEGWPRAGELGCRLSCPAGTLCFPKV